jgi:hypothetical protein
MLLLTHDRIHDVETNDETNLRLGIAAYFAKPVTPFVDLEKKPLAKYHDTYGVSTVPYAIRGTTQVFGASNLVAGPAVPPAVVRRKRTKGKKQAKRVPLTRDEREARAIARLANKKQRIARNGRGGEALVCREDALQEAYVIAATKNLTLGSLVVYASGWNAAKRVYSRRGQVDKNGDLSKRRLTYRQTLETLATQGTRSEGALSDLVESLAADLQPIALDLAAGYVQSEIAERLGKSQQWVSKQVNRIRGCLTQLGE